MLAEMKEKLIFQELLLRLANKINKITQVTIQVKTNTTQYPVIIFIHFKFQISNCFKAELENNKSKFN